MNFVRAITVSCCLLLLGCSEKEAQKPQPSKKAPAAAKAAAAPKGTLVTVVNSSGKPTTVYVSFGADSKVNQQTWAAFCKGSGLVCSFALAAKKVLPLGGAYLNATFSFGAPVTCGSTKAELNVNNPKWYNTYDISLVDGYSNRVRIEATEVDGSTVKAGPPAGAQGNEKVLGVFPLGCDICTERKAPPCGQKPGKDGCKAGTQYKPTVPCQLKGKTMGGGGALQITLLP